MTYLQYYRERNHVLDIPDDDIIVRHCPSEMFDRMPKHCQMHGRKPWEPVVTAPEMMPKCRECWNRELDFRNVPCEILYKQTDRTKGLPIENFLNSLNYAPDGKIRLALRIAAEILESELFLEAYPIIAEREWMKKVLTRVLWKNKVSTEDGRAIFSELSGEYTE